MIRKTGFTLIEILVVIAVFGILIALTFPYTARSYRHYVKTVETKNIISVLRRAETMATANNLESNYGVKFSAGSLTLFKGTSYASRDSQYDENYPISSAVTISAPSEIVFERISGRLGSIATISISNNGTSQVINIGKEGTIDW